MSSSSSSSLLNGAPAINGTNGSTNGSSSAASQLLRQTPLTCSGHTRPVVFLAFSEINPEEDVAYYCISACKGEIIILAWITPQM